MRELTVRDATVVGSTVRLAAGGDEVAFARLVAEHHAPMARVAYFIAGDAETAAEAVQAAWVIAWRQLRRLRDPERVGPWLVSIAANETRRLVGRQRRRTIVEVSVAPDGSMSRDPAERISVVDLGRALRKLSPDERSLLAQRYAAGLDSTQIGLLTGMSASGVRTRLARLLDRLRVDLDDA
jgi:RNA polymerase sigma factor (sigma-70 family)